MNNPHHRIVVPVPIRPRDHGESYPPRGPRGPGIPSGIHIPPETSLSRVIDNEASRGIPPLHYGGIPDLFMDRHHEMESFRETEAKVRGRKSNAEMEDALHGENVLRLIDLSQEDLVLIPTKDLNKRIKKRELTKNEVKAIKSYRRTLKNRGYAAQCRVKRDDLKQDLEVELEEKEMKRDQLRKLEARLRENYYRKVEMKKLSLKKDIYEYEKILEKLKAFAAES